MTKDIVKSLNTHLLLITVTLNHTMIRHSIILTCGQSQMLTVASAIYHIIII